MMKNLPLRAMLLATMDHSPGFRVSESGEFKRKRIKNKQLSAGIARLSHLQSSNVLESRHYRSTSAVALPIFFILCVHSGLKRLEHLEIQNMMIV